ncbi:MAG TPA: ATP-binding protein [Pseudonocardia sp.]|nr:ATP-binding protein [Pseudonocardia sp.]
MTEDALLTSLLHAVSGAPDDVPLRLHVAELLAAAQRVPEALQHVTHALTVDPGHAGAVALLQRLSAALARPVAATEPPAKPAFDWAQAEDQVRDIGHPVPSEESPAAVTEDIDGAERPTVRLADVGGMEHVKQRLELSFLGPIRNPQLASAFGATASGGLLLYGPPGCGKTFLARAVAGEIGAAFTEFGVADVLDMWTGSSERNLAAIFAAARRNAPCVLFFDEVDALGHKRSHLATSSSMRNTVNQLLAEMDSLSGRNDGVFVLGATNHPWDVDSALRRPGRFDRMLLVLPPDQPAREAILRHHLRHRPLGEVDLGKLARTTERYSGADLAHICGTAAEQALAESLRTNRLVPLTTRDLLAAAREVQPSTGPWFATARNVALFGNTDGSYDELAAYLRRHRSL